MNNKIIDFSIGNINAEIYCDSEMELIDLEQYEKFPVRTNKENTIRIKIFFEEKDIDISDYDIIYWGKTYFWGKDKLNKQICFGFGARYQLADIDKKDKDIWYALSDEKFNNVNLYIDRKWLIDQSFSQEFLYRPWIQRLIVEKLAWENTLVLHGAACSINGCYFVFLGDSGVGKSTLCKLLESKGHKVLADDRILLTYDDEKIVVSGTPWNTKNPHFSRNDRGILKKVFFLNHGTSNKIIQVDSIEIMRRVFKQVYKPLTCDKNEMINRVLTLSRIISTKFPGYELFFVPSTQVVTLLEKYTL